MLENRCLIQYNATRRKMLPELFVNDSGPIMYLQKGGRNYEKKYFRINSSST